MKTILCSEYQKAMLYHSLYVENGEKGVRDIHLLTVANLLRTEENTDDSSALLKLAHLLRKDSSRFPIYRNMFSFAAFLQEVLSFARECALYGISGSDLPNDTASEAELAKLVETALSMDLREKTVFEKREEYLQKAAALPGLSCAVRFEADVFRHRFLEDLKSRSGMKAYADQKRIPKSIRFQYAASVRQEAESTAQEIVKNNRPCAVVLCGYEETIPVVEQVFTRYGIPFSALHTPVLPLIPVIYTALAELALRKDRDALLDAFYYGAFPKRCPGTLLSWLDNTLTDVSLPQVSSRIVSDLLENDRAIARRMETKAEEYFESIREDLDLLLGSDTPAAAMINAYAVMKKSPHLKRPAELAAAMSLRRILNETLKEIRSEEDAEFILQSISSMKAKREGNGCGFCEITDLSHPVGPVETLYVLGCSGQNYPKTPVRSGLFDEAYTAKIPSFPSLEERHTLWNTSLSWLFESSDTLVASYASMDYQGREIQPAYEMESRMPKAQPWKLEKVRPASKKEHSLSPDTAYALFTEEDGRIHSSISRIERWFACPFSWFVESGLRVREPLESILDSRTLGNLGHAFFEQAVKEHGKEYVLADRAMIDAFLDPIFDSLARKLPQQRTKTMLTKERLALSIENTLRFLKKMEAASFAWTPAEAEYHFDTLLTEHVQLNGIIDRIDEAAAAVRVIDYKSSEKSLSVKKIKAGLQLQLLSYMIIAEQDKKKDAAGVYYMSMKPASAAMDAGSFKTNNKNGVPMNECLDPKAMEEAETKERRMKGWALADSLISDEEYARLFDPAKGVFKREALEQIILELYEYFFNECTSGRIEADPTEGACIYCKLQPVCRHHGGEKKPQPLLMQDETFKYGKKDGQ